MTPGGLRTLLSRLVDLARRRQRDQRLADEIEAHLAMLADEHTAAGMSPADARLAARKSFGGVEQVKMAYREQRGLPAIDALLQDVRFAVRLLARDRGFTASAVLVLGLGIGAAAAVFTIVKGMNLQSLPVERADRVMHLQTQDLRTRRQGGASFLDFIDWRRSTRTFAGLAAYAGGSFNLGDEGRPADRLSGTYISANGFDVLRAGVAAGRGFVDSDDQPGAPPVVILSHGTWVDRFGADPAVIGRTVRVNAAPAMVIGIMPAGFRFPVLSDVWQPLALFGAQPRDRRDVRRLAVFGRLADDVTIQEARAELATLAANLAARHPDTNAHVTAWVLPFTAQYAGRLTDAPPLLMMTGVAIVLLVSCANAANLLLARSVTRAREIALRTALGASRSRIVRQLLLESLLLAAIASAAGLLLSLPGVWLFTSETADANLPYWMNFDLDVSVLAFLVAAAIVTTVVFGLAPALHVVRSTAHDVLKDGGRGITGGARTRRWTSALLVGELALTLTLLAGAGLLLRAAAAFHGADTRIDAAGLVNARLSLPAAPFATADARRRFRLQLQERLDAHSGIASATIASTMPFFGATIRPVILDGDDGTARPTAHSVAIGDRYFETIGLPILRGRALRASDARPGEEGIIVNEQFAALLMRGHDPLGARIRLGDIGMNAATPWLTIVGVVPSIRQSAASGVQPVVYLPLELDSTPNLVIIVRARAASPDLADGLRREVHAVHPDVALFNVMSLERISQLSRWIPRAMSTALGIVAAIALVLSAMGLYAVTSYGVAQRTSEIGIRMALGSSRRQVGWLILRGTLLRVAAGVLFGSAGAAALAGALRGFLARTEPLDPATLAVVILILLAVAVVAALAPTRRAVRVDPAIALRHE